MRSILGDAKFATFMCNSVAARLGDPDLTALLETWRSILGDAKFAAPPCCCTVRGRCAPCRRAASPVRRRLLRAARVCLPCPFLLFDNGRGCCCCCAGGNGNALAGVHSRA